MNHDPFESHHWVTRSRLLLWVVAVMVLILILWAYWARLDEVVRGSGRVIPSGEVQVVQSFEGGIVEAILVREGERVEPEQVLVQINDIRFSANYQQSRVEYLALLAQSIRLHAESEGRSELTLPPEILAERAEVARQQQQLLLARQQEQSASLDILQRQKMQRQQELEELTSKRQQTSRSYHLANRELQITEPLVKSGVMSEIELLRLQREVNELKGSLDGLTLAEVRIRSALSESEARLDEQKKRYQRTILNELAETTAKLEPLRETMPALQDRVSRTALRSPVRGVVKTVHTKTLGGVIEAAQPLVEIVPLEKGLLIEAMIQPADIAFLAPGLLATIRFTAYDFAIYGGLTAVVEHISADSYLNKEGASYYKVLLRTPHDYLGSAAKPLPIMAGMVAEVDILTGNKSVLDYLLKPLNRMRERALRER